MPYQTKNILFVLSCLLLLLCCRNPETTQTERIIIEERDDSNYLQSEDVKKIAEEIKSTLPTTIMVSDMNIPMEEKAAMKRISFLVNTASSGGLTEEQYSDLLSQIKTIDAVMQDNGSGGGSSTQNCVDVYKECIRNHDCDDSPLICLCCAPCSLKYAKCILALRVDIYNLTVPETDRVIRMDR